MKDKLKKISLVILDFQANIILTLVYFLVLPLFVFLSRLTQLKDSQGWTKVKLEDINKQS